MDNHGTIWLLLGIFFFFRHIFPYYLLFCSPFFILVGCVASAKGRSFVGWFLLSALFSPVLTLLALVAIPAKLRRDDFLASRIEAHF